jgi:hypothetical protein
MGTGMTEDLAVSTLAGDYGTPAAAYSVRKVRTAYSGALMDVRRSIDNVTSSIGYVSNGDLDTGSLLDWVVPGRSTLPGAYSGLAAAYSLRRVSGSYTGSAIDVRRDSDNTTSSIGFNAAGNLDTGTLLAFVTGSANTGSGFVAQWYDQSGNGRHATQTATGSQPLIVSSGSLVQDGGKPSLYFDEKNLTNQTSGLINGTNPSISVYAVLNREPSISSAYTFATPFMIGNVADSFYFPFRSSGSSTEIQFRANGSNSVTANTGVNFNNSIQLVSNNDDGSTVTIYKDSLSILNTSSLVGTFNETAGFTIGSSNGSALGKWLGYISELIFYTSSQAVNRPLIENNINNYYNIYTGSNHGFVARWYDQSGNNRHATQTATGSQPLIVESGSVITDNNRSAVSFNGISHDITSTFGTTIAQPITVYSIFKPDLTGSIHPIYSGGVLHYIQGSKYISWAAVTLISAQDTTLNKVLNTSVFKGASSFFNINSVLDRSGNTGTSSTNSLRIGAWTFGTTYYFTGKIQEIVMYPSDQSSVIPPVEYGINNYYNIYTQPTSSNWATSSFTIKADSSSISGSLNNRLTSGIAASGPLGLITVSRTGSNSLTIARNGASTSFAVPASGALSTGIYLGAINNNGLALGNSPLNISFASVGTGLTNSETGTLSTLTHTLRYSLRGLDPDAVSFLASTILTDETQIQAVNNLVLDLKANNLWDKMTAIYPFVGASGDTHKYNLKNPTQFTVLFEGGWNHTNTGAATNGVNTRGNTQISPSTHLVQDDTHISIYARSTLGTRTNANVDIGNRPGGNFTVATYYAFRFFLSDMYSNVSRTSFNYSGTTSAEGLGYFIFQRTSPTSHTVYKNATLLGTNTNNGGVLPSAQMWIGANGTISEWSDREYSFISFGRGFTPTEVTTLTSIIQTYQTSLSRQI